MKFNIEQLDKLADLSMTLSKGLFLSVFTLPAFARISPIQIAATSILAIFFMLYSLQLLGMKEVQR